ncbi:Nif3-like dinuclear metal center hexameric protein, partial [bacterium]|nr:Nif3-like dinuclear metal center hexameric protein [bacterium]
MKKTELINIIETLAPLDTQEPWDNCGWQISNDNDE